MATVKNSMDSKGMQFAKLQLEKFGWKEGSGLGRTNEGITEALKPRLKFDSAGLGHTRSDEFTYKWWDHAFNKAASSFDVKVTDEESVVVLKSELGRIQPKKPTASPSGNLAYGVFQKAGTLNNGDMKVDEYKVTNLKEERDFSLKLSDEELFKLCGGRTAHKGARHGHRFSGKLARIAQQEALLLAKSNGSTSEEKPEKPASKINSTMDHSEYLITNEDDAGIKKSKKKDKKKDCEANLENIQLNNNPPNEEQAVNQETENLKPKKRKKESKTIDSNFEVNVSPEDCEVSKPKKKKKEPKSENSADTIVEKGTIEVETGTIDVQSEELLTGRSKKKKSKKEKRSAENDECKVPLLELEEPQAESKKSKKRKKNKDN